MSTQPQDNPVDSDDDHESFRRLLNIPNALCAIRLVGSFVLVGLAIADRTTVFASLLFFLLMTDWVDGKIAILFKQQTKFGAKLDTVADVSLYSALLFGLLWLKSEEIASQGEWIACAMASYAISVGSALLKFGGFPSYHTRAAKTCWLLVSLASIALFAGWPSWPIQVAALAVTLTNIEATGITFVLKAPAVDLPSIYHAWQLRKKQN